MIGLLQRVRSASVEVDSAQCAGIGRGLLVLVGIERGDDETRARRLLERLLGYRVFANSAGRMNLSLRDLAAAGEPAGLLLVPQFTLAADTTRGSRASFTAAAEPALAQRLFETLVDYALTEWAGTQSGAFGADMQVALVNDGPVTFWIEA